MSGQFLVYTGNGKGKTTAALGMILRCLGWNMKVCIIQFIKSDGYESGEKNFFQKNDIEFYSMGKGFLWENNPSEHKKAFAEAWNFTKDKISEDYDIIVLDEINNVFSNTNIDFSDILSVSEFISTIKKRPEKLNVVATGRGADKMIIEAADMVSEVFEIRHPFNDGKEPQKGIDF